MQAELYCFPKMGMLAGKYGGKGDKMIIFRSTCLQTTTHFSLLNWRTGILKNGSQISVANVCKMGEDSSDFQKLRIYSKIT